MDIRSSIQTPAASITSSAAPVVQPPPVGLKPAAEAELPTVAVDPVSSADVQKATETINSFMSSSDRSLTFSLDDDSGKVVVKVVDMTTKEVIRQFPSEEAIAISKSLDKLQGLLLSDKA
ncbi:flagellar protein FlaG [Pigmentiphaga aceris]|nr:flagellar protein FlaG [Pigmentiphaga aceris]